MVAPSLIPSRSGDRIKTDRRDALKLARLHRAGELTAVHVPDASDEAMRDLCRARTDAVQDQRRGRAQLKAFLLRNGYRYTGKSAWTEAHRRYLRELARPPTVLPVPFRLLGPAPSRAARGPGGCAGHHRRRRGAHRAARRADGGAAERLADAARGRRAHGDARICAQR